MIYNCIPITSGFDSQFQAEVLPAHAYSWSEKRRHEYVCSRLALKRLLQNLGITIPSHELEVDSYHHLKYHPTYLVSFSHNPHIALAMIALSDQYQAIGVDIESCQRFMKPELSRFFLRENDDHNYSHLQLWTLKEAAFKALYPIRDNFQPILSSSSLTLKDIWIQKSFFGYRDQKKIIGTVELSLLHTAETTHYLAKAAIPLHSS